MKIINKPWGKEEWLELNDRYCYKRIYINAGYKTSYQYHIKKYETNYLIAGNAELWLENDQGIVEKKIIHPGDFFNVSPPKKHRIIALTDIILQEVSTPEVDDVIRIEDDTHRKDGKLEEEQKQPAVLILAAGLGTRVRQLAKNKNKALIPINNKAIISYIIEKFPVEYEIVMAVGYQKESLMEYCKIAHPDRTFTFIEASNWNDPKVGPGVSAHCCMPYLQRPFYLTTADTIIDGYLPYLDGNWLGVYPTECPEKYSTIKADKQGNVLSFVNKSGEGFDNAFTGLASIRDYTTFWSELENNIKKGGTELVTAWFNPKIWSDLRIKYVQWLDTGNLDDIQKTKEHFKDNPLSLFKHIDDTTYKIGNRFLKFSSDKKVNENRYKRGIILGDLVPSNLGKTDNFIYYDWEEGKTLYEYDSLSLYEEFLHFLFQITKSSEAWQNPMLMIDFYSKKTEERKNKFLEKYGQLYLTREFIINGIKYPSLQSLLDNIDFGYILNNPLYKKFHGDLQFDNIVYNTERRRYYYIDWRESCAGNINGGDIYYDLSKLYGGCILPYNLLKDDKHIKLSEGSSVVDYSYSVPQNLILFREKYEEWLNKVGFGLKKVKLIKSLIYLNMSPLHTDKFNKLLWFKSIEGLYNHVNQ